MTVTTAPLKRVAGELYVSRQLLDATPFKSILQQIRSAAQSGSGDSASFRASQPGSAANAETDAMKALAQKLEKKLNRALMQVRWTIRRFASKWLKVGGKDHMPPNNPPPAATPPSTPAT